MTEEPSKTLVLLYHFFHPDDVISARLYADLGAWASKNRWRVVAMPTIRSCHDEKASFPSREVHDGVEIRRVWRPAMSQTGTIGRLVNTMFVLLAWTWRAIVTSRSESECVVIGTDPPLGVLAAIPWRLFRRRTKIIHWCHDLYPDAAVAEGMIEEGSLIVRLINWFTRWAYLKCDYVVDLGSCMRSRLQNTIKAHGSTCVAKPATITPWALVEPKSLPESNDDTKTDLFGCSSALGFLYSGNLGRAHSFAEFVGLAKLLESENSVFCFAGRGPKIDEVKTLCSKTKNLRVAGFASELELLNRLSAADVHLVSLQPSWTGCVVPSKFFGALSVGRPVLFSGSDESAIAKWIREYSVGWVLSEVTDYHLIANELSELARNRPKLLELHQHCFEIYRKHFSKQQQLETWSTILN
ncbi:MAG: glycosyltransferase family 4 protein [Pirellulales bacterium]